MAQSCVALTLLVVLVVLGAASRGAEAAMYNVGDSAGWDISADFPSWLSGKTFYVGDNLGTRTINHGSECVSCFVQGKILVNQVARIFL